MKKVNRHFAATIELSGKPTPGEDGTLSADENITCVISTQNKISNHLWDKDGNPVDEYILTRGARFPQNRSVPLFYGHNYDDPDALLGSVDELRISGDKYRGTMNFSDTRADMKRQVREGFLNAVSVGLEPTKCSFVKAGEQKIYNDGADDELFVDGGEYGAVVYEVWNHYETSATPVPANREARISFSADKTGNVYFYQKRKKSKKSRIDTPEPQVREKSMNETKQAIEAPVENKTVETPVATVEKKTEAAPVQLSEKESQGAKFAVEVMKLCRQFKIENAEELIEKFSTLDEVRKELIDRDAARQAKTAPAPSVTVTSNSEDRFAQAMTDAMSHTLLNRLMKTHTSQSDPDHFIKEKIEKHLPTNVDPQMKKWNSLVPYCMQQLEREGRPVRFGVSTQDIITRAIKGSPNVHSYMMERTHTFDGYGESGYVSTGDVLPALQDALHKVLIASYEAAKTSWQEWVKNEGSTPDLKNFHFPQLSGTGYIDEWVEGQGMPIQKSLSATDAILTVKVKSNHVSIPWHVMANDDLGAMAYVPAELGKSFNKTINLDCYNEILSNGPVDEDSEAFFGSHTLNVPGGGSVTQSNDLSDGSPTSTTVSNMMKALATMLGKDGTPISLQGRFLVGPWKYDRLIRQICLSQYDPTQNLFEAYNPYRTLLPISDPLIDLYNFGAGQNYYFLFPELADSPLRIVFRTGEEMPVMTSFLDVHTDAYVVKGRQSYGVRAIDYRRAIREH